MKMLPRLRRKGNGFQLIDQLAAWSERVVDGRREVAAGLVLTARESGVRNDVGRRGQIDRSATRYPR